VAGRGKERVENVLDGFTGWRMTDGVKRHRKLTCWRHRKLTPLVNTVIQ
jgi:hypothetical protein